MNCDRMRFTIVLEEMGDEMYDGIQTRATRVLKVKVMVEKGARGLDSDSNSVRRVPSQNGS